jgi:hypothetical protein
VRTEDASKGIQRRADVGMDIMGSLAGAAIGGLIGGPPGAASGAVLGPAIAGGMKEVTRRALSEREEIRVNGAFTDAMLAVQEHLQAGREPRTDGFFEPELGRRPKMEEIVEGALVAAQREHEELKVTHYGYLIANVAFDAGIDLHTANWCLRAAQELSWTQLVLLRIVADDLLTSMLNGNIGANEANWGAWTLHEQLADLGIARRNLINAPSKHTPDIGLPYPNMELSQQKLAPGGQLLHGLMWLDRVPQFEVDAVFAGLAAVDHE